MHRQVHCVSCAKPAPDFDPGAITGIGPLVTLQGEFGVWSVYLGRHPVAKFDLRAQQFEMTIK